MRGRRRILIIGNYTADKLQSMERYANLLIEIYKPVANVRLVKPTQIITRLPCLPSLLKKYLAYIDKLILFPTWLLVISRHFDLIHIADHSNGFYSFCCPREKCVVTCHDLLAVRGARGDKDSACTASILGPFLQRLIMAGLRHSGRLLFVSERTRKDYHLLGGGPYFQRETVIPNPLNASFSSTVCDSSLSEEEIENIPDHPFLLMVGSSLPRKNRKLALRLIERLGSRSPYYLVFAGASLSAEELAFKRTNPLGGRIISIVRPSHALLNQLYCRAHALLFPSLSEGFGWPLIEAQACDCPVIASTTTSIPEVAGTGALYAQPHDVEVFYQHVCTLKNDTVREELIRCGRVNLKRFSRDKITESYLKFAFST